jgi:hypothetical protein
MQNKFLWGGVGVGIQAEVSQLSGVLLAIDKAQEYRHKYGRYFVSQCVTLAKENHRAIFKIKRWNGHWAPVVSCLQLLGRLRSGGSQFQDI